MQRSATLLHTRSQFSWRAARNIIYDSLYARVNAKLKASALRLLSDLFFFFSCQCKWNHEKSEVFFCESSFYVCATDIRETLEEKPLILPTDSPASADLDPCF